MLFIGRNGATSVVLGSLRDFQLRRHRAGDRAAQIKKRRLRRVPGQEALRVRRWHAGSIEVKTCTPRPVLAACSET